MRSMIMGLALIATLVGCKSTGTTTTPVAANAAQTVGRDQRQLQGTESGSAINNQNPTIVNLFGFKAAKVTTAGDETTIEAEGHEDSVLEMGRASFGNWISSSSNTDAKTSSGGATGGGGDAASISRAGAGGTGQ